MRIRFLAIAAGMAITATACGSADAETPVAAADQAEAADLSAADQAESPNDGPVAIDVLSGESDLGPVLTGPDGRTLYGFTNDVDAISTCYGTCADAWPPVIVSDDWTAGPGLDFGIFATTVREDGQSQLVAGRWPLYYFAGDAAPGDVKGQNSGDVWFAADVDGGLIKGDGGSQEDAEQPAAEAPADAESIVAVAATDLGEVMVDADGLTLYGFLDDRDVGGPSCNDACADAWPPLIVIGSELPVGLDPEVFSVMTRDDGSLQLAAGIWPLYLFAGDGAPGDINGQGSGDVWFAVDVAGGLVGAPAAPAASDSGAGSDDAGNEADTGDSAEDGDDDY